MTWFSGNSFGSYLGGAMFEIWLAPLFYIQIYLFILLGFSHVSRANPDSEHRRIPNLIGPRIRLELNRNRNLTRPRIWTERAELFPKIIISVVQPHSAPKHFTNEHPFDHLALHTLKYEVMGFGSTYIFWDPHVSYLCGISHSFIFFFFSNYILTWLYI